MLLTDSYGIVPGLTTSRETYDPHPEDAWKRLKMRLRKPQVARMWITPAK